MKKKIVLIHTVLSLATNFKAQLLDYLQEDYQIYNIWDDFLAINANQGERIIQNNRTRLLYEMRSAELTGADLIVVTCSTLTPTVEKLRPLLSVPVIAIDDALGKKAVLLGQKLLVLATAKSGAAAMSKKLLAEAAAANVEIQVKERVIPAAFTALNQMEMERHDKLVMKASKSIVGYEGIVLAQASMAHLEEKIAVQSGIPVLSSPKLCMEEIKQTLTLIDK